MSISARPSKKLRRRLAGRRAHPAADAAFSEEVDAAESAITRLPDAWPPFDHGTRRYLLRRFPGFSNPEESITSVYGAESKV